jgi:hypothetical protein
VSTQRAGVAEVTLQTKQSFEGFVVKVRQYEYGVIRKKGKAPAGGEIISILCVASVNWTCECDFMPLTSAKEFATDYIPYTICLQETNLLNC